ncbi:MAG: hypothetical protein BHV81_00955 [Butyricimonas synergistica]|nr:MAG: hypothetical protein BHV81_00955 [Butyricimonas synergistica]
MAFEFYSSLDVQEREMFHILFSFNQFIYYASDIGIEPFNIPSLDDIAEDFLDNNTQNGINKYFSKIQSINNSEIYPILRFPHSLITFCTTKLQLEKLLIYNEEETLYPITSPQIPQTTKLVEIRTKLFFLHSLIKNPSDEDSSVAINMFLGSIAVIISFAFIFPWILTFLIIHVLIVFVHKREKKKEELKRRNELEQQFENETQIFNATFLNYIRDLIKLQHELRMRIRPILDSYLKNSYSSISYNRTQSPPQRGFYENKLFEALMYEFPQYVKVDVEIEGYYPDITLEIDDNIYIDIEIDEPYEFKTKKEIHYIGIDDNRNKAITDCNWFVLRFAEDQIKYCLEKCVDTIKALVNFIKMPNEENLNQYLATTNSIRIKQWTKEEARLMAIQNSRKIFDKKKINNLIEIPPTPSPEDTTQNKVIIIPFDDSDPNNIIDIADSQNPDFVRIRVESSPQVRIHRFTIAKEVLDEYKLGIGSDFCKYFPECRISVRERVGEPFWKLEDCVQPPKMTPANEEKGTPAMVHLHEGLPIYRQTFFNVNSSSPNYEDVFVQTTGMITEEEFNTIYK